VARETEKYIEISTFEIDNEGIPFFVELKDTKTGTSGSFLICTSCTVNIGLIPEGESLGSEPPFKFQRHTYKNSKKVKKSMKLERLVGHTGADIVLDLDFVLVPQTYKSDLDAYDGVLAFSPTLN
jgi:hypothetical protein